MNVTFGALAVGILLAGSAFGTTMTLGPAGSTGTAGSGTVPNNGSTFAGLTLVTSITDEALTPGLGSNVQATGSELVYRTGTGTLDFFYQVTNNQSNSSDNLRLVTLGGYTGATTAVAYNTNSGSVAPSDAFRSAPGDTLNFDFLTSGSASTLGTNTPFGLGSTSDWLEVDTTSTTYALTGFLAAQDTGNASMLAYAPSKGPATVPEPTSLGLFGGGLAALGIVRWRKYRKA
jgi:hypothetical protein